MRSLARAVLGLVKIAFAVFVLLVAIPAAVAAGLVSVLVAGIVAGVAALILASMFRWS